MHIFLAIVMGPGLGFMLYAMCQFWLEERNLRKHPETKAQWRAVPVRSFPRVQREHLSHEAACDHNVVAITQPVSRRSVERDVA